ncbi:L-fucose mutarotase [Thalassotalea montiporae]
MLNNISPLISPELLLAIYQMGHGDEIVLADAHFPGHSCNQNVIRADGLKVADLLDAILPLMQLDQYVESPAIMMQVVPGDSADSQVEQDYHAKLSQHQPEHAAIAKAERFEFYQRAEQAFAVVMTGETRKYGNIILKKGVTQVSS